MHICLKLSFRYFKNALLLSFMKDMISVMKDTVVDQIIQG